MEPIKLQKIDEVFLSEHSCLEPTDYCYFIGEYAGKQGFEYKNPNQAIEDMNNVIHNFKKPMSKKGRPEWFHKEKAILKIAEWFMSTSSWEKLKSAYNYRISYGFTSLICDAKIITKLFPL